MYIIYTLYAYYKQNKTARAHASQNCKGVKLGGGARDSRRERERQRSKKRAKEDESSEIGETGFARDTREHGWLCINSYFWPFNISEPSLLSFVFLTLTRFFIVERMELFFAFLALVL